MFKIISKNRYEQMVREITVLNIKYDKKEIECDRLREANKEITGNNVELYNEVNSLEDQVATLKREISNSEVSGLKDLYIVGNDNRKCEKCPYESDDCKKLIFANQTICVTNKKNVNTFTKKKTKK